MTKQVPKLGTTQDNLNAARASQGLPPSDSVIDMVRMISRAARRKLRRKRKEENGTDNSSSD